MMSRDAAHTAIVSILHNELVDLNNSAIADDILDALNLAAIWEEGLHAAMQWTLANRGGTGPPNPYTESATDSPP